MILKLISIDSDGRAINSHNPSSLTTSQKNSSNKLGRDTVGRASWYCYIVLLSKMFLLENFFYSFKEAFSFLSGRHNPIVSFKPLSILICIYELSFRASNCSFTRSSVTSKLFPFCLEQDKKFIKQHWFFHGIHIISHLSYL